MEKLKKLHGKTVTTEELEMFLLSEKVIDYEYLRIVEHFNNMLNMWEVTLNDNDIIIVYQKL
jgi:hypothetical protein